MKKLLGLLSISAFTVGCVSSVVPAGLSASVGKEDKKNIVTLIEAYDKGIIEEWKCKKVGTSSISWTLLNRNGIGIKDKRYEMTGKAPRNVNVAWAINGPTVEVFGISNKDKFALNEKLAVVYYKCSALPKSVKDNVDH